jgi:hypothetical protein
MMDYKIEAMFPSLLFSFAFLDPLEPITAIGGSKNG